MVRAKSTPGCSAIYMPSLYRSSLIRHHRRHVASYYQGFTDLTARLIAVFPHTLFLLSHHPKCSVTKCNMKRQDSPLSQAWRDAVVASVFMLYFGGNLEFLQNAVQSHRQDSALPKSSVHVSSLRKGAELVANTSNARQNWWIHSSSNCCIALKITVFWEKCVQLSKRELLC